MAEMSMETELALILVKEKMLQRFTDYRKLLRESKTKKSEAGALVAGYNKAANDLYEVLSHLVDM